VLVLTRKTSQSIMIGDDVEVIVLSHDATKVRLGIRAPAEVPVHRKEIYLAIKSQEGGGVEAERSDRAHLEQAG
jgi:carbon storage regulator